jgi:hypothetical protein
VTLRLALFVLVLGPACSVTALAERERSIAVNECASASECVNGECIEGLCVSQAGELNHLAFELIPTARAGAIGGKSMWILASDSNESFRDLVFGGISRVTGYIQVAIAPDCMDVAFVGSSGAPVKAAVDRTIPPRVTIPARVTFTQTANKLELAPAATIEQDLDDVYGFAAEPFTASVDTQGGGPSEPPFKLAFQFNIPAGFHDIYIEPSPIHSQATIKQRDECTLAPQLLLNQAIASYHDVILTMSVPRPAPLLLEVRFPADGSFADWQLDMIDPESGRVLSTRITIPDDAKSGWVTPTPLRYLPVAISGTGMDTPDRNANELVRLAPPAGLVAPTFLFERSALELFEEGSGVLSPLESMPTAVDFEGQVLRRGSSLPVPASVTLTATRLLKVPTGVFATFSRTVTTDAEGRFELPLLPGSYRVEVAPSGVEGQIGGGLAPAKADWEVPASPKVQAGRVMEVDPVLEVEGRASVGLVDTFALGASVGLEPSVLRAKPNALARLLGESTALPRSARTSIGDTAGNFAFSTDPGIFDFFVRPPEESNLAWYVMPGLELQASKDLGTVALPLPVRLTGSVAIQSFVGPEPPTVTQALLRAYVLLDEAGAPTSDDTKAKAAVAVAETRVDESGHYVLNVPASLKPATNPGN